MFSEGFKKINSRARFIKSVSGLLVLSVLSANVNAESVAVHRYLVKPNQSLSEINVTVCFTGRPDFNLVAESLDASLAYVSGKVKSSGESLKPSGEISLKKLKADDCFSYLVDISRPIMAHDARPMTIKRIGGDVVTVEGIWLWRPKRLPLDHEVEIIFDLPTGVGVSVPWSRAVSDNPFHFLLEETPYEWPAFIAFGNFKEEKIVIDRSVLRVTILESQRKVDFQSSIMQGIEIAARLVRSVTGSFPADDLQVLVEPGAYGPNPIAVGYVSRGGKPAVHLHINERKHDFFSHDSTILHEFAHLLLPKVRDEDSWLTEGLATYYEYILAARSGHKSVRQTLDIFTKNFERARLSVPEASLLDISKNRAFAFGRDKIYWGGAAIFFAADVRLRLLTNDQYSLDDLIAKFQECCHREQNIWSGEQIFAEFDALTGHGFFQDFYKKFVVANGFPDVSEAFNAIGFEVSGFGQGKGEDKESKLRLGIFN